MNSMNDTGVVAGPEPGQTSHAHRLRGLAVTGCIATLAAMAATTIAAALAGLHLVPATVMVPTLTRSLRTPTG
jgi:hypothetical protein